MPSQFSILVIDDDPNLIDILTRTAAKCFEQAQFTGIQTYEQATAYLDDLQGRGPSLALLDIDLKSSYSGLDFLTRLRTHPQGRLLPVIVLSTRLDKQIQTLALERGANALTLKPETYEGWQTYLSQLRAYWAETVTLPKLWFDSDKPALNS